MHLVPVLSERSSFFFNQEDDHDMKVVILAVDGVKI